MSNTHEGLAMLYEEQHGTMVRRLRRLGAAPWRAEEVVQEAYLRLLTHPAPLQNPRAYLYRIAQNLLIDTARQEQRRGDLLEAYPDAVAPPAEAASGETSAIDRETTEQLHTLLAEMPEAAREALALRLDGLTFAEIAEQSGAKIKAAFDRTGRALSLLRAGLEQDLPADPQWRSRLPGRCPFSPDAPRS